MPAMSICNANLAYSFAKPAWQLWSSYFCGLIGIWGWGLGFESAFSKKFKAFDFFHAFLEGTVLVSFLMLLLSISGFWNIAWFITVSGSFAGVYSLRLEFQKHRNGKSRLANPFAGSSHWELILLLVMVLPTALYFVLVPLGFGDTAAIWGYHAKVLSCNSLFDANFVREKVWAGTHPDYPLFLSFLHALFFSLGDSFRDDWIKIWQSVSLLFAVLIGFYEIKKVFNGRLHAFAAVVTFLAICGGLLADARVELNSALFVWLISLALISNDPWRLSIYLLGFVFCKNEGLAGSLFFVASILTYSLYRKEKLREQYRAEHKNFPPFRIRSDEGPRTLPTVK